MRDDRSARRVALRPCPPRTFFAVLVLWLALFTPSVSQAHDFRPGTLTIVEYAPGSYRYVFIPPVDSRGETAEASLRFPQHCTVVEKLGPGIDRRSQLSCGTRGLAGWLALDGEYDRRVRVIVMIRRLGAADSQYVMLGTERGLDLERAPSGVVDWIEIGIEHILTGYDHLAFIIGLLLLLGWNGPLLATLTAFTVAHSITLACATLEIMVLPSRPVEALIALSVVLLAHEAARAHQAHLPPSTDTEAQQPVVPAATQPGLAARAPWLLAAAFGLVHGLGFAGALAELGLGRGGIGPALLGFNLGVELGQLAVVLVFAALLWPLREFFLRRPWLGRFACVAIGGFAAYWFIARVWEMIAG